MSRFDNPDNPNVDRLKNAERLFIRRVGKSLCLMSAFEVKPFGLYMGAVSTLEPADKPKPGSMAAEILRAVRVYGDARNAAGKLQDDLAQSNLRQDDADRAYGWLCSLLRSAGVSFGE